MDSGLTIDSVEANNHRKAFVVRTARGDFDMPYWRLPLKPEPGNPVRWAAPEPDTGGTWFTYELADGSQDAVPLDGVLDFNRDPDYMRDMLLFELTVEALKALEVTPMSRRQIIRRMGTSPSQFYRLIDTTNYRKSLDQMVRLLQVLECRVDLSVAVPTGAADSGPV